MAFRPRIAIPVPTTADASYNQLCWPEYAAAVASEGGEAVRIELTQTPGEIRAIAASCTGILLPGSGADVHPARYGHDREPESAPADSLREEADFLLLEHADRQKKPLLGICFGLQSLNVYRGGTLLQHLLPVPVNHGAGRSVIAAHTAMVSGSSHLGEILSSSNTDAEEFFRIMVNTSHHQAVGTPGENLRIVARSTEDGVIEALEDQSHPWLIGVQWHPERTLRETAESRALFSSFLQAARGVPA